MLQIATDSAAKAGQILQIAAGSAPKAGQMLQIAADSAPKAQQDWIAVPFGAMLDPPSTLRQDESSLLLQALCITLASDTVATFKRPRADAVPPCPPRRLSGRSWFPARCEVGGVNFEIHPVLKVIVYV